MANKLQRPHAPGFPTMPKDTTNVFSNSVEFVRHHREASTHSWDDDEQNEGAQLHRELIKRAAEAMGNPIIDHKTRSKSMPKMTKKAAKKATKPGPTPTEDAVKEVEGALEDLCALKIPIKDYIEALEDIHTYVDAALDAAREDMARAERGGS